MSDTQHRRPWAPAPWRIERQDTELGQQVRAWVADSGEVASWWGTYADDGAIDVSGADAALIALAPRMAEAILHATDSNKVSASSWDELFAIADELRKIIKEYGDE